MQKTSSTFRELQSQKEIKAHEAEMIRLRIETSTHQQQLDDIKTMEAELAGSREGLLGAFEEKKTAEAACKELTSAIKSFEKDKAKKMKEIENTVTKAKKEAAVGMKKWKDSVQEVEALQLEIAEAESECSSLQTQVAEKEAACIALEGTVAELEEATAATKRQFEEAKEALDGKRQRISDCEKQIGKLNKARNSAQKKHEKAELEIKKVAHKLSRLEKDNASAAALIESFLKKYPWIKSGESISHHNSCHIEMLPAPACGRLTVLMFMRVRVYAGLIHRAAILRAEEDRLRLRQTEPRRGADQVGRPGGRAGGLEQEDQQEGDGNVREGRAGIPGPGAAQDDHRERQVQDREGHRRARREKE